MIGERNKSLNQGHVFYELTKTQAYLNVRGECERVLSLPLLNNT